MYALWCKVQLIMSHSAKGTARWFKGLLWTGVLSSCLVKRDLPELLPRAFWKWKDAWVYLDILWDEASTVKVFGVLFLPRADEASCPTVHTGLKLLGQPPGWYSQVSHLNVWKALGASFNWFILGAEAPCITLASLEKEYFGNLPWGCNPCGKGRHGLQKACYQWTWWGPGKQNC